MKKDWEVKKFVHKLLTNCKCLIIVAFYVFLLYIYVYGGRFMPEYDREKHLKDLEYFIINQNELCNKYKGLVLLLQNATVINAYNSPREASDKGKEMFGYGNYSIQPCIEGEQAYSMECYSPRIKF